MTGASGTVLLSQCSHKTLSRSQTFPQNYISQDGLLSVDMVAQETPMQLGRNRLKQWGYNGQIPGPRLEAKPGDTIKINFQNQLPQTSNLHYHGLHIPPTGTADNVFVAVPPGEQFSYEFTLPKKHPSGTFWYHPHYHGQVAEQVFKGLAGLLIVRGELDEIPEIQAASEQFLVFQDFTANPNPNLSRGAIMLGREGELVTVNGKLKPEFSIPTQGLVRLHLLNASISRFYRLSLDEHPFYLIATDGGAISEPVELTELLLAPGERVQVLIQGDRPPSQYQLLSLPYDRGTMGMMGHMGLSSSSNPTQAIATFNYTEPVAPTPLPKTLIPITPLPEPQTLRQFTLNHGMNPGMGMVFLINNQAFNHQRIDVKAKLNQIEDWEIINLGGMDHPFHIHVNAFQIISRNQTPEPLLAWKDVVNVRRGETVRLRIQYQDFIGKTVYHCHILDHEDRGMMGILEIA
ncbi:multicopper oxidase family protein [Roseofilum sp. BLCC_M91]|uniref:Multicopper oxidase family protein n=1 Tax=Roseofilum halophilum BLCC-M91 TaxID=3022259 RepID=A0ABT7BHI5_9CYAN|nr:multicopper oxidase family protein [Roseofilum halophilum]MDJ1178649.1 multicopper oxidase family protein [Roseofilum halophilum BLCC-M91]